MVGLEPAPVRGPGRRPSRPAAARVRRKIRPCWWRRAGSSRGPHLQPAIRAPGGAVRWAVGAARMARASWMGNLRWIRQNPRRARALRPMAAPRKGAQATARRGVAARCACIHCSCCGQRYACADASADSGGDARRGHRTRMLDQGSGHLQVRSARGSAKLCRLVDLGAAVPPAKVAAIPPANWADADR